MSSHCLSHPSARRPANRSVLACAVAALATPVAAQAQSTTAKGPLPASSVIVVTATRTPVRADQALADVTVIDRAQIEAATGRTLAELLARQGGVQVWANGGLGTPASVSLRGTEARHVLLLIDGVRYGSATLGTPIWDNLPLDAIERIEIVRGPMSGLYGRDAVGGEVQIFTRGGKAGFWPEASLMAGSHGTAEGAAGARFGSGPFDGSLRVQHLRTTGFSATNERVPFDQFNPDRDGFRQSSLQARAGLKLGGWRAEALGLVSRGTTHYDDGLGADAQAGVRTSLASLSLAGTVTPGWQTALRLSRTEDVNDVRVSASPWAELGATGTVQRQFSWENHIATPLGTVLALAEHLTQDVTRPVTPYEQSRRTISAVALGLDGKAGAHSWQANVRRDRNSQFGSPTTGSLAYGYELLPGLRATASAGKSFVAPSFNQLYYPGFGNPALLPEEGRSREVALRWERGRVRAHIAYYEQRIRGYISSGPQPGNIPRTRIDGVAASLDADLGAWTLSASLDAIDPVNTTDGGANAGKLLPRRATDSARLSADWRGPGFTLGGTLNASGPRFDDAANTLAVPGYATLDLRADWPMTRDWSLGLRLNNALNQRYETLYGYNQPGREAFVTLRWAMR